MYQFALCLHLSGWFSLSDIATRREFSGAPMSPGSEGWIAYRDPRFFAWRIGRLGCNKYC